MYTKPILYRIYSIVLFALSVLGFISSVGAVIYILASPHTLKPLGLPQWSIVLASVITILSSIIALFISYMNFSSMYTFADMIKHVESGKKTAFRKPCFTLSGKAYSTFGSVIFIIVFIAETILMLALIIATSIASKQFISLPMLPLIGCVLYGFLVYVTFYVRYKSFGNLLTLLSTDNPSELIKSELSENKPNILRGYCTFLFVLAILFSIVMVVLMFVVPFNLTNIIGVKPVIFICIGLLLSIGVIWIDLGIQGCYFDNLGNMIEHFLIKYNLLDFKKHKFNIKLKKAPEKGSLFYEAFIFIWSILW